MTRAICWAVCVSFALLAAPAMAGNHSWRVNELFSNADGTIQFVELKECCGMENEVLLAGAWVLSETTGNQFTFPDMLPAGSTANQYLLLATQGFVGLPGAPTPDHILVDNFMELTQDTINYIYIDDLTFGAGELPTNGLYSLYGDGTIGVNSPTNFSEESGSIDVSDPIPFLRGDCNDDGAVDIADPLCSLDHLFGEGTSACRDVQDSNDDGTLDIADPVHVLNHLFVAGPSPSPPFPECGLDPTPDALGCLVFSTCP